METKICTKCKKELPLTDFYTRGEGKYRSECKECHNNYVKLKYRERKQNVNQIKIDLGGCKKCGEMRPYVLDFHHLNPDEKDMTVSRMSSNKNRIEDIKNEIDKCIVLCANCHREFHFLEEREGLTIEDYLSI